MSNFFNNFPLVEYLFGDDVEQTALFQNISAYINIIDELSDDVSFYNTITIGENERSDTVSFRLYDTTEFYWTFYYLNDHIRESGWPLTVQELYKQVKIDYPNRVVVTNSPMHDILLPGTPVRGSQSSTVGTVVKRNLDMGQLIIRAGDNFNAQSSVGSSFEEIVDISDGAELTSKVTSISESAQYDAIHHYENSKGEYQFLTPNTGGGGVNLSVGSDWLPVTYWERYEAKNFALRQIKVLTPNVARQVQAEFNKLLKQG